MSFFEIKPPLNSLSREYKFSFNFSIRFELYKKTCNDFLILCVLFIFFFCNFRPSIIKKYFLLRFSSFLFSVGDSLLFSEILFAESFSVSSIDLSSLSGSKGPCNSFIFRLPRLKG